MIKGINPNPATANSGSARTSTMVDQQAAMLFNAAIAPVQPRQQSNPDGGKLKTADMQALFDEYAQLQPQHQTPAVKARLDQINQELQRYREAYNPKGEVVAQTKKSTLTILKPLPNELFETTHADFQKAVRQDFKVTQGKTYNVSGTDLLEAIEENTRSGHTAGADNNKNGAFDPSRDRHGLGKVIDKFTDKVLDNPIVRTVAQVAQFTPFAPVASVVNTVITARDVVKAVDEGNIKSLASTVIGAGLSSKLSNSLNLAGDATKISVAQQLQKQALDGLTRATVSTVVAGEDFDDQLKSSLKASAANIISQIGANKIGDLYSEGKLNDVTHKLAHTALGFTAGTAANGDGFSGAVGGLAGSIAGEYFQSENAAVLASAASAALLGGDPLLAANVAGTADRFNRQLHQTEIDLIKEKAEAFADKKGITKAEATKILLLQALHQVDSSANQRIPDNAGARAFLKTISGGNAVFNDAFGQKSNLFLRKLPPLAPFGVDIDANIKEANDSWDPRWFRDQVKNKGVWDFKQRGSQYENFGNFHYGVVGAAFGFPDSILLNEAGRAQVEAGTSQSTWGDSGWGHMPFLGTPPYGDDPNDQYWIQQGIDFYKNEDQWLAPPYIDSGLDYGNIG